MSRVNRIAAIAVVVGAMTLATTGISSASAPSRAPQQAKGGEITFGLEAESTNYCLTGAQLAASGIQVVKAVYDTLTVPNSKGEAVPYLAKSVKPNADFTVWTIGLREGVTFHDGTPVDAAAIKANLDSYYGAPDAPNVGSLIPIVLGFVQSVAVTDPLTVTVTLKTPVSTFPAYLYLTGRMGIMAPAQLNSGDACKTNLIGSGPFKVSSIRQNEATVVTANPNYWQKGYPKAAQITFIPVTEGAARTNQLQGGQLDMMHTSSATQIAALKNIGNINALTQKPGYREINYSVLVQSKGATAKVFGNETVGADARKAYNTALDRKKINQIQNRGTFTLANGLMDTKAPGYLKNAGYPKYNPKKAKALVAKVKAGNDGAFDIVLGTTTDAENSKLAQQVQEQLDKVGITATIAQFDQATLINKAISGDIDVLFWRNLHGGYSFSSDPDNYPWWSNYNTASGGKNAINFAHFNDPDTQAALDKGRTETTPAQAKATYTAYNKAFAKGNFITPMWYVNWTIGSQKSVKVALPALPDGAGKPLFVYGVLPVIGLSKK